MMVDRGIHAWNAYIARTCFTVEANGSNLGFA